MITVYLKPTNYCNVGCDHCYLPESVRATKDKMSFATLSRTGEMLAEMMEKERHDHVHVIWHGGEPMVLSPEWYWQAGEILDGIIPGHSESMQSSLIPFREEFLPLISERFGGEIGSSIDFASRSIKGSASDYQDLWLTKVNALRSEGILVVPGIVPSKKEIGKEKQIVEWFESHGFRIFNIDRYNSFGQQLVDSPSNKQHADFLTGLFDVVLDKQSRGAGAPLVRVLAAAIGGVLFGQPGDRWGGRCQSDFVVVEPDGSLNNCPDKTSFEKPYANVFDGFSGFASSDGRRNSIRIQVISHKKDHCTDCENNSWCKSGCPITKNGPDDGEEECSGYKSFLTHVRHYVSSQAGRESALEYLAAFETPGSSLMAVEQ